MSVDCLLDTNIIAYAFSNLPSDAAKRQRAEEVMRAHHYGVSAQVLQELYTILTRKAAMLMPAEHARVVVENFAGTLCVPTDAALVLAGIDLSIRYQISYWDGAVLAAAERLGAPTLYTEDLNHGQRYGTVTVINPFRAA